MTTTMTTWMGWSAAHTSRPTWEEWRDLLQRRVFFKQREATMRLDGQADTPDTTDIAGARTAELERLCRQLSLENVALRTALQHWQHQLLPVGA